MSVYKILTLTTAGGTPLEKAEYLPEYDAIVLDPPFTLLGVEPGRNQSLDYRQRPNFAVLENIHARRNKELATFFHRGGVLLVRLVEPSWLYVEDQPTTQIMESFSWWLAPVLLSIGRTPPKEFARPGSGTALTIVEPGHPFEMYLRSVNSYTAWLDNDIRESDGVVVLAENRAHQPVAVEIACYPGAAVLVPPPTSEGSGYMLSAALRDLLNRRVALSEEWPTAEEQKLLREREEILGEMRARRDDVDRRLVSVRDVKAGVITILHVSRAIGYYRQATATTPTPKRSIPLIWNMLELLRDHYTRGNSQLAELLGLPKADLEFVQRIANKKDLDVRHTEPGQPRAVTQSELDRAVAIGGAMVQATIDYECRLALTATSAPQAAGQRSNGSKPN